MPHLAAYPNLSLSMFLCCNKIKEKGGIEKVEKKKRVNEAEHNECFDAEKSTAPQQQVFLLTFSLDEWAKQ